MEGQPKQENLEELKSKIDALSREGQNEEALALIESLPEGEEKFYKIAYIGANLVEAGDLDGAQKLVDKLSQNKDFLEYAGGVLELIMRAKREIE